MSDKTFTCKICGQDQPTAYKLHLHRQSSRPDQVRTRQKLPQTLSALDRIRNHQREIEKAIHDLEVERQTYHDKIVQIDNLVAKYKTFNAA